VLPAHVDEGRDVTPRHVGGSGIVDQAIAAQGKVLTLAVDLQRHRARDPALQGPGDFRCRTVAELDITRHRLAAVLIEIELEDIAPPQFGERVAAGEVGHEGNRLSPLVLAPKCQAARAAFVIAGQRAIPRHR
jgi:SpoVK/Ycf46/Vps4 family AAA+-type ATPase